jgi:hypothetical protein
MIEIVVVEVCGTTLNGTRTVGTIGPEPICADAQYEPTDNVLVEKGTAKLPVPSVEVNRGPITVGPEQEPERISTVTPRELGKPLPITVAIVLCGTGFGVTSTVPACTSRTLMKNVRRTKLVSVAYFVAV